MSYNEAIAQRVHAALGPRPGLSEKLMFGGLSFLVNGKMIAGVIKNDVVVRADPAETDVLLQQKGVRPMDFTGRPMKGFLYLSPEAYQSDASLTQLARTKHRVCHYTNTQKEVSELTYPVDKRG